jgi:CubicO group peptidase (beta-lactamase class C family)
MPFPTPSAQALALLRPLLAGILLFAGCAGAPASVPAPAAAHLTAATCPSLPAVYPDAAWERIPAPECAGFSSAGLQAVRDRLSGMATTGFVAIVGGRILMDYGDIEAISYLASVRKSILSMLYGIHVDRGVIDLDENLADIGIEDIGGLSNEEKQATVRDLLSARSGIYHEASNAGDDLASAPPRGSKPHGTYYLYNNWDFNALGTIFETKTGIGTCRRATWPASAT